MPNRPRMSRWVRLIDAHIVSCNIRGPFDRFHDVASDALDGAAFKAELRSLIRRGYLEIVEEEDDSMGRDQRLCGTSWSVNPTRNFIETFWPDRLVAPAPPVPMTPKQRRLARKFAAGRITVYRCNAGPETRFSVRYRPKLAGEHIAPTGIPDDGYLTRTEAIAGGLQYRDACRAALARGSLT